MAGNDKQTGKQDNLPNQGGQGGQGSQGRNPGTRDPLQDMDQGSRQSTNQPGSQTGGKPGSSQSDTSGRGFASMDPNKQREIASEGGKAAHAAGTAHEFTSQEAREAGRMSHKNDGNQQSGQGNQGGTSGKK